MTEAVENMTALLFSAQVRLSHISSYVRTYVPNEKNIELLNAVASLKAKKPQNT